MKNWAGFKVQTTTSTGYCNIHVILGASGPLPLTESFRYVRTRVSHYSCPPYLIHRYSRKKKIMSADSMQSPHSSHGFVYRVHLRCLVPVCILAEHDSRVFIDCQDVWPFGERPISPSWPRPSKSSIRDAFKISRQIKAPLILVNALRGSRRGIQIVIECQNSRPRSYIHFECCASHESLNNVYL